MTDSADRIAPLQFSFCRQYNNAAHVPIYCELVGSLCSDTLTLNPVSVVLGYPDYCRKVENKIPVSVDSFQKCQIKLHVIFENTEQSTASTGVKLRNVLCLLRVLQIRVYCGQFGSSVQLTSLTLWGALRACRDSVWRDRCLAIPIGITGSILGMAKWRALSLNSSVLPFWF